MNILVIGKGGREHALAWKLAQSPRADKGFVAPGKGVIVCKDTGDALKAIERIMVRDEFGTAAGRQVVVEKRLEGDELSLLALVSNRTILPLPPTQDHKAAFDNDEGPNTGGMGAY